MPDGGRVVAVRHFGDRKVLSEKQTIRFVFHDFASLPHRRGDKTQPPPLQCHGHEWTIAIYPGGHPQSNEDVAHMSLFLKCASADLDDVKATSTLRVPNAWTEHTGSRIFNRRKTNMTGIPDVAPREDILRPSSGFLVDGNLIVEAEIQVHTNREPAWRPKSTLSLDMLQILESATRTGDVKFEVGDTSFYAHRAILENRAPELAALAEEYSSDTPIPIDSVKPSTFRSLLRFAYADEMPEAGTLVVEARELLVVADRFGCKGLKLAAEAELAESGVTAETAADLVLLGDAMHCALLKETAMDFFAANPASVKASSGWANVKESASVLSELMDLLVDNKRSAPIDDADERECKRMRVSTLRQKLDEKGLDVDGSRDMLVNRLEQVASDGRSSEASSHGDN